MLEEVIRFTLYYRIMLTLKEEINFRLFVKDLLTKVKYE